MDQPCFLRHVALHGLAERLKLGNGVLGSSARCFDRRRIHTKGSDLVGKLLLLLGEGGLSTGQFRLLCAQRLLRGSLLLQLGLERLELCPPRRRCGWSGGQALFRCFPGFP